ncbi:hypothetical protein HDU81_001525, partial [Chytriomyces hyalinus]
MPSVIVDLLHYNAEHAVGYSTLAKVTAIVSRKVASKESAAYWNLGDRPEWDPSTQYGSPYIRSVVFQEMFEVDRVLLDTRAEMNDCAWALDTKAGSCIDRNVLMTMFNEARGSSCMFGMLHDCKLCFPGPICLHQKVFIAPKAEKTPFVLLMGMPAIVSCEVFDSQGNLWHKLTNLD